VTEPQPDRVRRATRATVDAGLGYGLAAGRAALRAGIGLGRAGTDLAMKVLDQSPIGDAAGAVADRLEPAAERARVARKATAEEIEALVGRVTDEIVRVVNIDGIIRQVDVDDVIRRVDVDDVVSRVDIDDILSRVDVDGIVRRTEVGTLIVQSTGGVVTQMLDFLRSLGVAMDGATNRTVDKVLHRGQPRPVAPVLLEATGEELALPVDVAGTGRA
jgi:hypothetical protein